MTSTYIYQVGLAIGLGIGFGVNSNNSTTTTTTEAPTTTTDTTTDPGQRECLTELEHPKNGLGQIPGTTGETWRARDCPVPGQSQCPNG